MLRIYVEILKHYYGLDQQPNEKRMKALLRGVIRKYIEKENAAELRSRTSAEDGREKVATDIIERIYWRNRGFAVPYLQERGKLKRRQQA
jgi:hypothetical protein